MNSKLSNIYQIILDNIKSNSQVLDLGCGNGKLLAELIKKKGVKGIGVDNSSCKVLACIKQGIAVIHQDMEKVLAAYPDKSYDYVILSRTLQTVKNPGFVLKQILRIGKTAIVSFPNFAHYKLRLQIFFKGQMPKSKILPHEWYSTPNIHLLTIKDFVKYCLQNNIYIIKKIFFRNNGKNKINIKALANCFAQEAVFLIKD